MPRPRRAKVVAPPAQVRTNTNSKKQDQDARIPLSQKSSNSQQQSSRLEQTEKDHGQKNTLSGQARFIAHSRETPALGDVDSPQTQPAARLDVPKRSQTSNASTTTRPATRKASISVPSTKPTPNKVIHNPSTNIVERVTDSFPSLPPEPQPSAPPSALKLHGTPSFLSISNFKKRPRQPSLLRMVQKSMGGEFGLGEDSADDDSSVFTLGDGMMDDTLEGLGDTTEVQAGEAQAQDEAEVLVQSSGTRKRKRHARDSETVQSHAAATDFDSSPPQTPSLERRKSDRRGKRSRRSDPAEENESGDGADAITLIQSSLPAEGKVRSRASQSSHSELRVNPQQSSSRRATRNSQQQEPINPPSSPTEAASPLSSSSPPASSSPHHLEVATKNRRGGKQTVRQQKPAPLKTAALQSLLPRRRLRLPDRGDRTDEFEILDSSDEARSGYRDRHNGEDDDDADVLSKPSTRRPRGALSKSASKAKSESKGNTKMSKSKVSKSRATTRAGGKRKAKQPLSSTGNGVGSSPAETRRAGVGKTYGKQRPEEDKENSLFNDLNDGGNDVDEDVIEVTDKTKKKNKSGARKSKEMEAAAKRFKEVDEWELSFESCDLTGGSSPWR